MMSEPPSEHSKRRPIAYLQLVRENREFRRLWLAEVLSFLGDWFNTIAIYVAVAELTSRTEAIAAVLVARQLPVFLMTPLAGPLIDRFDRRKLMIFTDVARALCVGGLIVAHRLQSLPMMFALVVIMMCFAGIFIPTKTAVLPQLTTEAQLSAANALSSGTWSVMLALGAALGGVVTEVAGVEIALAADGLTFLLSALLLYGLPSLLPLDAQGAGAEDRSFSGGLSYLRRFRYLLSVIGLKPGLGLAGGALALLPLFAVRDSGGLSGPLAMGIVYASRGLGALLGSLLPHKLFGDVAGTMHRVISIGFVIVAMSYVGLSQADSVTEVAAAYFFAAVGGGAIWVFSGTIGQRVSDNEYRGRVFTIEWGGMTLAMSATAWLAGMAIDRFAWTLPQIALATALAMVIPLLAWLRVLYQLKRGAMSTKPA